MDDLELLKTSSEAETDPVKKAALKGLAMWASMEVVRCLDPRHGTTYAEAVEAVTTHPNVSETVRALKEQEATEKTADQFREDLRRVLSNHGMDAKVGMPDHTLGDLLCVVMMGLGEALEEVTDG